MRRWEGPGFSQEWGTQGESKGMKGQSRVFQIALRDGGGGGGLKILLGEEFFFTGGDLHKEFFSIF